MSSTVDDVTGCDVTLLTSSVASIDDVIDEDEMDDVIECCVDVAVVSVSDDAEKSVSNNNNDNNNYNYNTN